MLTKRIMMVSLIYIWLCKIVVAKTLHAYLNIQILMSLHQTMIVLHHYIYRPNTFIEIAFVALLSHPIINVSLTNIEEKTPLKLVQSSFSSLSESSSNNNNSQFFLSKKKKKPHPNPILSSQITSVECTHLCVWMLHMNM